MMKIFFTLFVLLSSIASIAQSYSGGAGSIGDPYLIANKDDLKYLSENSVEWTKYFKQSADIVFDDTDFQSGGDFFNSGDGFIPIGDLSGTYDGDNYSISNLFINRPSLSSVVFIGMISTGATVANISLVNVDVTGGGSTGSLIGTINANITVMNCNASGLVTGENSTGGLIGYIITGNTSDCSADVTVNGVSYIGGLIGYNQGTSSSGNTANCFATGDVTGSFANIGGLIGYNQAGNTTNCFASGDVQGDNTVGGLLGYDQAGNTENCYATGDVNTAYSMAGGLIGYHQGVNLTNCYSIGAVIGSINIGGLCGAASGTISNCFWDTQTSGLITSPAGTGKTTTEMQTISTFTLSTWDFVGETINGSQDIWEMGICSSGGYPVFSYESANANLSILSSTGATICGSDEATVSATASVGSLNWYTTLTAGTAIITDANYSVSGNDLTINNLSATTSYFVEAQNGSCFSSPRTEVIATSIELPLNTVTLTSTTLSANEATAGAVYQWLDCNNSNAPISGETNQDYTPGLDGNYAVEVTLNACTDTSTCFIFSLAGLEDVKRINFSVYPNPSNGVFIISVTELNQNYQIIDITGKVVMEGKLSSFDNSIELNSVANGTYILKVNDQSAVIVKN
jgi:hypothetical protein